jgi:L-threonylcarbamoyladenylate synthase
LRTAVHSWQSSTPNAEAAARTVDLLRQGETVALPTETVYGLAADALNPKAVAKIFDVKLRPRFDPLIVHLPQREWLERIARLGDEDRQLIEKLVGRFWPGPFTIILPRRSLVPDIVTAGLETVAVRMSSHPVFAAIIGAFNLPMAAPSANRFGRISPTTAQHVLEELEGRIPMIIDAGPTTHGLESTIVTVRDGQIDILRSGPVTKEKLEQYGKVKLITETDRISAPGQLPTHYAPRTPLQLIDNGRKFSPPANQQVGLLAWRPIQGEEKYAAIRRLSERYNLRDAAANLFRQLRELDAMELDLIVAERVPEEGLGAAIMDRLRRAAAK